MDLSLHQHGGRQGYLDETDFWVNIGRSGQDLLCLARSPLLVDVSGAVC